MKKIYFAGCILSAVISCKNESPKSETNIQITPKDTTAIQTEKKPETKNKTPETAELPILKECTEQQADYETVQECTFSKIKTADVYRRTIKEKDIENAEQLFPELPKQTVTKEINQDGLISVTYTVKGGKTDIVMTFEGGVTSLSLEQQGENVKRIIAHSAD